MKLFTFYLVSICLISLHTIAQNHSDSIGDDYFTVIEKYRNGRNIKLMYLDSSPLTLEQKKSFDGLKYFEPDKKYRVWAKFVMDEEQQVVKMKTKTERVAEYIRYGKVHFEIDGIPLSLVAFQSTKLKDKDVAESFLFIPFRDETSGYECYGGGRYLDANMPGEGNRVILDFNRAYNPYCAYNPVYSCVIPPDENRLSIRIEAGEKTFDEGH